MKAPDILSLARENVRALTPYSSARDDFNGTAAVFLDANENPFPSDYNRYPDPHQHLLKKAVADLKNVDAGQVFLGNGSDEAIDLLFRVFCEPGRDEVVIPRPTYGMYNVSASINNIRVIAPILTPAFELDAAVITESITPATKLVFLCSPNNPSGNLLDIHEIELVLNSFPGIVIIDEAYIDFAVTPGWVCRLGEFPNLVVLQTFSKAWGLAGLRLGMCFAHPVVVGLLDKIKPPYNINAFTQHAVQHAITTGQARKNAWVEEIKHERNWLVQQLKGLPLARQIFSSDANFLLVQMTDAKSIYERLVQEGIIVRDRSNVILCENCLRITIGTHEENNRLIKVLKQL